jgi:hypothetical protein
MLRVSYHITLVFSVSVGKNSRSYYPFGSIWRGISGAFPYTWHWRHTTLLEVGKLGRFGGAAYDYRSVTCIDRTDWPTNRNPCYPLNRDKPLVPFAQLPLVLADSVFANTLVLGASK